MAAKRNGFSSQHAPTAAPFHKSLTLLVRRAIVDGVVDEVKTPLRHADIRTTVTLEPSKETVDSSKK
jgi:hypothetical protein